MEDAQIISLYLSRNEHAIRETDRKYRKYCYSIAYNILQNAEDANEIVNDTYFGAWNSIPPHIPEVLSAYLGKITRNLSLKRLRTENTAKRGNGAVSLIFDEIAAFAHTGENVEQEVEARELAQLLTQFLESLPETEWKIFVCRYWYFDSVADLAERFGFSQSKVKSMLFRIRCKLQKRLKEEAL